MAKKVFLPSDIIVFDILCCLCCLKVLDEKRARKKPALDGERVYFKTCAQQESNLYLQLRRLTLYPLSYGRENRCG